MKDLSLYTDFITGETKTLLNIDSPTGYTENAAAWVKNEFTRLGFNVEFTRKGGVLVSLGGPVQNNNGLLLEAHVDTLGGMVAEVKASGRLRLTNLGGMNPNNAETEIVRIVTKSGKIYEGTFQLCNASLHVNKEYNDSGCPFLDFRNSIKPDSFSRSIIIYGHHRRNGTMFAHLKNYNEVEFYKNNPVLRFDTIYERSEWIVFSNFRTTTSWSTGVPFDYLKTSFKTDDEFLTFVNEIKKRSLLNMPVDVRADDKILLLSTCSYEKSNWRMIIAARRIRDGESSIDVSSATKAANPVMP